MDVQKKLDEIVEVVNAARSMPMSASCVINRADLLAMLEEVREALPGSLAQAQELIGERERMVGEARAEAERIIRGAHDERGSLVADTAVARQSQGEADRILNEARREAAEVKADADDYVDSKLANFEVVLTKTLGSVGRGREKLLGTSDGLDAQGYEDPDYAEAPERSGDPETLRRRADEYVDVKLGAFEAVLAKTLDAVGRGRDKLHGRVATDDLAALGEDGGERQYSSDSDYLADLAATRDAAPGTATRGDNPAGGTRGRGTSDGTFGGGTSGGLVLPPLPEPAVAALPEQTPQLPAQQPYAAQTDGYGYAAQTDAYGYPQQTDPYAAPADPYGYPQPQDPYAAQNGYGYPDPQQGYEQQPAQTWPQQQAPQQPQGGGALDETSFFDTTMISAEQLRAYEQGR
ncbi:cell division initiation protein [Streptomyces sp. AM 3-1-1]|uniref:cell division initiation protein n=1 Tax=Streptomyces sp. AM 3-1-1 TaxID=3028711 RepID=UPI0023B9F796|nr:cell division initiation protein [Streptomyces sp. AM 3-1-1]WEH30008.1 cell division initiation protein [Streptomyces sp. AM 3-1-1]